MNTHVLRQVAIVSLPYLFCPLAHADQRASALYAIQTEAFSGGSRRSQSTTYGNLGTLAPFVGTAQASTPETAVRHGFMGQLYEVSALQLTAASPIVAEGQIRQIKSFLLLDDLSLLALTPTSVTWSIQSGPLLGINSTGLVTAASVSQDTAASVQGAYAGLSAAFGLTVLNINASNLVSVAFDLNPAQSGSAQLPQPQRVGPNYVLSFSEPTGVTGFTYGAEWSPSMAPGSWTPITDTAISPQHNFSVPIGSNTRVFMRMVVSQP